MNNIPDWLTTEEQYIPKKDSSSFINKSMKSVLTVLSHIRKQGSPTINKGNPAFRLAVLVILTALTATSGNFSFVILMAALVIARLALLSGDTIKALFRIAIPATLFSALIMLPTLFLGNPQALISICTRVFICVSMASLLSLTTELNEITSSLKLFFVPNIIIFTLDLALKHILILGELCADMLTALKLRSIGKNRDKKISVSGILGITFIKAKSAAQATYQAMECRGFNGKYSVSAIKSKPNKYDFAIIALLILIITAFIYLEVVA